MLSSRLVCPPEMRRVSFFLAAVDLGGVITASGHKRHSAMLLATSAPGGEADQIGGKADIGARTSAPGCKAEVIFSPARVCL